MSVYKPVKECQRQDYLTINEYDKRLCHPLNVTKGISNYENITYRVLAYNTGSSEASDPSKAVFPIPDETGELNTGFLILYIIIGVIGLVLIIFVIICICNKRKYSKVRIFLFYTYFFIKSLIPQF